ncbi:MAG: hypothetical protein DHS20C15_01100 [Planctomycetota bacterium]|nr:MAG: hypothetical protein DHS20C15_01100 [Planctomycetota bacterium]
MIETFFESFANAALAVMGISFLIFIHEAGHFVAARLFDVRVETFSIGFGPRLFGWTRRGTEYRVSIIPLGGYVKMAGEYGDLPDDEEPDPGDLMAKPIWQRVVIFSAGVVVNIAFAFVLFPIAFGTGVPFLAPVVGDTVVGGAAWQAGLRTGDEILSVNGQKVWGFEDLTLEIALGDPDNMTLDVLRDGQRFQQKLTPSHADGHYSAQILPPRLNIIELDENDETPTGLRNGDVLLAVNGRRIGSLYRGEPLSAWRALSLESGAFEPASLSLTVERDGNELQVEHSFTRLDAPEEGRRMLGAAPVENLVRAVRGNDTPPDSGLLPGDVVLGAAGHPVYRSSDLASLAELGAPLELRVQRDGTDMNLVLDRQAVERLAGGDVALERNPASTRMLVSEGGALSRAGLLDGDEPVAADGEELVSFQALLDHLKAQPDVVDHEITYRRNGEERSVSVRAVLPPQFAVGFGLQRHDVVHDLGFGESLSAGFDACMNALRTTGMTLGKLFTGEVGADNLGGPAAIAMITYESAKMDFSKLLYFLALLSVNLGVINILPIPVLDGGQIMFLLFEKVKGGRLSDRFLQNAQLTGLVAILGLMVYVTFNDLSRLVG